MKSPSYRLDDLLTVEEVAAKLHVSKKTVRSWVYRRRFPFTRLSHRVYFSAGVIEDILVRNAVGALPCRQVQQADSRGGAHKGEGTP